MKIIGITGKAGSGKDTIGTYLNMRYKFFHESLAAPIKRLVKDVFVVDGKAMNDRIGREEQLANWPDWTVRKMLQHVGTEMFRATFGEDIWVKSLCLRLREIDYDKFVITDVRFPNERDYLRKEYGLNFTLIRVVRPGYDGAVSGIPGHASEAHVLESDFVLDNTGTVADLCKQVDGIMGSV